MSKIRKILVKIFECPKRAPEVPRTWDRCRKMVFRSIFGEITNVFNSKNFGSKFSNVQKGPQRSLEHGIDVEKWFLDRFSAKLRMSKIRIFLVKSFECPQRAPEVPRTWDRCRKMVFKSISAKLRMSLILKILVKIFECPKRAPEVSRTWDRCRKMVFRSIFDGVNYDMSKNSKIFGQNFRMSKKGPRGPQNMGSMQKNGFQIDFRRSNDRMSKNSKFFFKIFECPKWAPEVPTTWDRCRKMVFRSIFGEIMNV